MVSTQPISQIVTKGEQENKQMHPAADSCTSARLFKGFDMRQATEAGLRSRSECLRIRSANEVNGMQLLRFW
eukprot:3032775-Amphidinium_carterae.1